MTLVAEPPVQTTFPTEAPVSEGARLAQWIRAGCADTVQAFGLTLVGEEAACALGALYWGVKGHTGRPDFELEDLCETTGIDFFRRVPAPTGAGCHMALYRLIVTLNDTYRWTREQIADWLEENL